jgi:hypothetical protein
MTTQQQADGRRRQAQPVSSASRMAQPGCPRPGSSMTAALVRIPPVLYLRLDGDKAPHPPEFGRLDVAGHELHRP